MKEIIIEYKGKIYKIKVSIENAYSYEVFKFEWENVDCSNEFDSPVFIKRNKDGLVIPDSKNIDEFNFFNMLSDCIFIQIENPKG